MTHRLCLLFEAQKVSSRPAVGSFSTVAVVTTLAGVSIGQGQLAQSPLTMSHACERMQCRTQWLFSSNRMVGNPTCYM